MAFCAHRAGRNLRSDRFVEAAGRTALREGLALRRKRGKGRPRKVLLERTLHFSFRGFYSRAHPFLGMGAPASLAPALTLGREALPFRRSPAAQGLPVALVMSWTL